MAASTQSNNGKKPFMILSAAQDRLVMYGNKQERADSFTKKQATNSKLCGDGFFRKLYMNTQFSCIATGPDVVVPATRGCSVQGLLREVSVQGLMECMESTFLIIPCHHSTETWRCVISERNQRCLPSWCANHPSAPTAPSNMLTWLIEYGELVVDWDKSIYWQDLEEQLYNVIQAFVEIVAILWHLTVAWHVRAFMGPSSCVFHFCRNWMFTLGILQLQKTRYNVPWRGMLRCLSACIVTKISWRTPPQMTKTARVSEREALLLRHWLPRLEKM